MAKKVVDYRTVNENRKKEGKKITEKASRKNKVAVKIDSKTTIFVDPDNIEESIERYKRTHRLDNFKPKFKEDYKLKKGEEDK